LFVNFIEGTGLIVETAIITRSDKFQSYFIIFVFFIYSELFIIQK
jgi:hypothetical protein